MATVTVKLQRYRYRCPGDQEWSEHWVVAPSYEDAVVLVSDSGTMVAVLPDRDPVWTEIDQFIDGLGIDRGTPSGGALFRRLFAETMGGIESYSFDHRPKCGGGKPPTSWGPSSPPEFRDRDIEIAGHEEWLRLSVGERELRLREASRASR
jgi:hypothetical protein